MGRGWQSLKYLLCGFQKKKVCRPQAQKSLLTFVYC